MSLVIEFWDWVYIAWLSLSAIIGVLKANKDTEVIGVVIAFPLMLLLVYAAGLFS